MLTHSLNIERLPWLIDDPARERELFKAAKLNNKQFFSIAKELSLHQSSMNDIGTVSRRLTKYYNNLEDKERKRNVKIAFLSNTTIQLAIEMFALSSLRHGLEVETMCLEYDQASIACLSKNEELSGFAPDFIVVAFDYHFFEGGSFEDKLQHFQNLRDGISKNYNAQVLFQNLTAPPESLFGSYDVLSKESWPGKIAVVNDAVNNFCKEYGDSLVDINGLVSRIGAEKWFDREQWFAHKLPFHLSFAPIYCDIICRIISAIKGKSSKCLVLDLDNTVWGGIIGDDGMGGIVIGQGNSRGEAHLDFQRFALSLRERGIMLAVCSKNTDEVAREPFKSHPDMLLKEEHITVFQANWKDKASNIKAIAKGLNIGLDSLVFADDNPMERAHVRAALPEVSVPELGNDPANYTWLISAAGYFESISFSAEDQIRAQAYDAEAKRLEVKEQYGNDGDYLESLGMKIRFAEFDELNRPRITQLINKTNQFNLTTRRYTENEVKTFEEDPNYFTLQARLSDRFGDSGMIAVVIGKKVSLNCLELDSWLMSCRVLGRKIEEAMMQYIVENAKATGINKLLATYIPTAKNSMVAGHYEGLGFKNKSGNEKDLADKDSTYWTFDIDSYESKDLPLEIIAK